MTNGSLVEQVKKGKKTSEAAGGGTRRSQREEEAQRTPVRGPIEAGTRIESEISAGAAEGGIEIEIGIKIANGTGTGVEAGCGRCSRWTLVTCTQWGITRTSRMHAIHTTFGVTSGPTTLSPRSIPWAVHDRVVRVTIAAVISLSRVALVAQVTRGPIDSSPAVASSSSKKQGTRRGAGALAEPSAAAFTAKFTQPQPAHPRPIKLIDGMSVQGENFQYRPIMKPKPADEFRRGPAAAPLSP
ncbi:hypothetical protein EVAR_45040_1 [Eumeta japonica]|uniref:Uncharacterized protein n=1 Tax=Eumeta variegata TaxID=151549 RepID=A0A4C1YPB1_EUMVA|nr:hypothetical protein EVAR_45040_1 [Eumeta japonica]